ncbi:MAG TPA: Wzz/FepE/Etk N-terminal domain-containing protein [Solirubrobacteraceae bacterium]|nr:Wzz/FepE/Etk N-terminal domain-containing protein [Solirubrobacteraceae bacterium]
MNETTEASAVLGPLWRRKWLVLAVAVIAGVGSYLYYRHKPSTYSASTQVYLANGSEEQSHVGSGGGIGKKSLALEPATQAALINSSIIKETVKQRLRKEPKSRVVRAALKGKIKAKAGQKSQFLTIGAEAHNAKGAVLLVNTTAQAYVKRQNDRYRKEILQAILLARRQERKLEVAEAEHSAVSSKKGKAGSSVSATLQAATLANKINQLESDLSIRQVAQVNPAGKRQGHLVGPHPKSNAIFGFLIGLLLACFAVYLLNRFDRRLRTIASIEAAFHVRVLSALQAVRRPLLSRDGRPVPARTLREALWRLQTVLQVAPGATAASNGDGGAGPRVILFTSAEPGDGKSTLIAALALVQAESGERVAVIEADFRNPVQSRLLGLSGGQGLADVLSGRLTAEEALQEVPFARIEPELQRTAEPGQGGATATVVEAAGSVSLLAGATKVANPPALMARPAMSELPRALADEYDYVLVDAPGPLQVSDAMPLLDAVDGIVLVARAAHTREASASRLMQLLANTPAAPLLGVVANGVSPREIKKYGLSSQYRPGWLQRLLSR